MHGWLILLHRYLGIGLGWLLLAWCLSGVVMMYVAYPEMTLAKQAAGLPPLALEDCCATGAVEFPDRTPVAAFRVEMLDTAPVLRLASAWGERTIGLHDGQPLAEITAEQAARIAARYRDEAGLTGDVIHLGAVMRDQWTVGAGFEAHRPLQHFALSGPQGTELYVSSTTGELVQSTSRRERFWNWIGSVTHWLYPTLLRQHPGAWIQVIIWTSVIGLFLVVMGLYIGITRLRLRRSGRWSPYRGIALWHHYLGLVFGLLTLTWLASGLLSVNPWGALEGRGFYREAQSMAGMTMTWGDVRAHLTQLERARLPSGTVRLEAAPFAGRIYYLAYGAAGEATRLEPNALRPAPLAERELAEAARRLRPELAIADTRLLVTGDEYYFDHHVRRAFPVYRVTMDDEERTRYYIDAVSGRIVQMIDAPRRWHRWLFAGLHRFDFTAALRQRPVWDAIVIALLIGVTGVCFTGTYMGIRYLLR